MKRKWEESSPIRVPSRSLAMRSGSGVDIVCVLEVLRGDGVVHGVQESEVDLIA
jgi:hypothetical protein